jgi:hypothetical protein
MPLFFSQISSEKSLSRATGIDAVIHAEQARFRLCRRPWGD